jgi:hypothetical protein
MRNKRLTAKDQIDGQLLGIWHEIKDIVDSIELDVLKTTQGNMSAGVRARHGLRILSRAAIKFVLISIKNAKEIKCENDSHRKDRESYASLESCEDRYDFEWPENE